MKADKARLRALQQHQVAAEGQIEGELRAVVDNGDMETLEALRNRGSEAYEHSEFADLCA